MLSLSIKEIWQNPDKKSHKQQVGGCRTPNQLWKIFFPWKMISFSMFKGRRFPPLARCPWGAVPARRSAQGSRDSRARRAAAEGALRSRQAAPTCQSERGERSGRGCLRLPPRGPLPSARGRAAAGGGRCAATHRGLLSPGHVTRSPAGSDRARLREAGAPGRVETRASRRGRQGPGGARGGGGVVVGWWLLQSCA